MSTWECYPLVICQCKNVLRTTLMLILDSI